MNNRQYIAHAKKDILAGIRKVQTDGEAWIRINEERVRFRRVDLGQDQGQTFTALVLSRRPGGFAIAQVEGKTAHEVLINADGEKWRADWPAVLGVEIVRHPR